MEISASEIDILARRINDLVSGYSLSGAYSMEGGLLFRLRHETKQELLIAVSSFASWITTKNLTLPRAESFVSRIRGVIERCRLVGVRQAGNERITEFSFESKTEEKSSLFAEFFAGGNLVLVDENGVILDAEKAQRFRHRNIIPGEKYSLPPSRGVSLAELTKGSLASLLEESRKSDGNLAAIKWFGRNTGTSRKFVEEIFYRARVRPDLPLASVSSAEIDSLANAARDLEEGLESGEKGYLLLSKEESGGAQGVDVSSLVPNGWNVLVEEGRATIQEFATLGEALDEAQVQVLVSEKRSRASRDIRGRAAELDSAISKQDLLLEKNRSNARELRNLAGELMQTYSEESDVSLETKLETLEIVEKDTASGGRIRFVNEPRSFVSMLSERAIASRLFDEAKALEEKNRNISLIREDLEARKEALLEQSRVFEDRAAKRIELERRAREWFERYRWFLTSDLRLAVGGRDSTSNS
ncbi:MAG: NFACT family protein, partial [Nitrososphaerales archaeon]